MKMRERSLRDPVGLLLLVFCCDHAAARAINACDGIKIKSIALSSQLIPPTVPRGQFVIQRPSIGPDPETDSTLPSGSGVISAFGPALGSMDSPTVAYDIGCKKSRLVLVATIVRSENFAGAVLANVLWQPKVQIAFDNKTRDQVIDIVWVMRLTDHTVVDRATTPPFAPQSYPIRFTLRF